MNIGSTPLWAILVAAMAMHCRRRVRMPSTMRSRAVSQKSEKHMN